MESLPYVWTVYDVDIIWPGVRLSQRQLVLGQRALKFSPPLEDHLWRNLWLVYFIALAKSVGDSARLDNHLSIAWSNVSASKDDVNHLTSNSPAFSWWESTFSHNLSLSRDATKNERGNGPSSSTTRQWRYGGASSVDLLPYPLPDPARPHLVHREVTAEISCPLSSRGQPLHLELTLCKPCRLGVLASASGKAKRCRGKQVSRRLDQVCASGGTRKGFCLGRATVSFRRLHRYGDVSFASKRLPTLSSILGIIISEFRKTSSKLLIYDYDVPSRTTLQSQLSYNVERRSDCNHQPCNKEAGCRILGSRTSYHLPLLGKGSVRACHISDHGMTV